MSVPPCIVNTIRKLIKVINKKGVKMTQLNETLFSTIVHEYHTGGVKSSYGLSAYDRKALLKFLFSSKACYCINCLDKEVK